VRRGDGRPAEHGEGHAQEGEDERLRAHERGAEADAGEGATPRRAGWAARTIIGLARSFHCPSPPTIDADRRSLMTGIANHAAANAANTARQLSPAIERLARVGYAAKGVVYVLIGALAARAALGTGGRTTDSRGALAAIGNGAFGTILLGVIALGLLGYAAWRFVAAATDAERAGDEPKGIAKRLASAGRGVLYAGLAVQAIRLMRGAGGATETGSGGGRSEDWTARLMAVPYGRWLVAAVGLGIVAYAVYQLYRAYAAKVRKHLDLGRLSAEAQRAVVAIGRFGIGARGVVFLVIGWFLVRAARQADASEATGMAEALRTLQQQPYGKWILALVGLGFIAYGLYEFVNARFRRIAVT
jgi:hypothetical protein